MSYAESKKDVYETLTGIFAANEAIIKASSGKVKTLNEIELKWESKVPSFSSYSLSISHSERFAVAVAINSCNGLSREREKNNSDLTNQSSLNQDIKAKSNIKVSLLLMIGFFGGIFGSIIFSIISKW